MSNCVTKSKFSASYEIKPTTT